MNKLGDIKWHIIGTEGPGALGIDTGGKMVPWLPIVAAASFGVSAISDLYSQWKNYQFQSGALQENERYWQDYYRNTGVKPRYPYRSGYYQNSAFLYSGLVRSHTSLVEGAGRRSNGWLYK